MKNENEINVEHFRSALRVAGEYAFTNTSPPSSLRIYPRQQQEDKNGISVYYAPFEFLNPRARIVLVGITPGDSQMRRAWASARRAMGRDEDIEQAISEVKRAAAFNDESGQMRKNLYAQLEHWGVPRWLGLQSGMSLFAEGWNLVQTTSLVRFPTFCFGKNYKGQSPLIMKHSFLCSVVFQHFVEELRAMPEAVVFPLGSKVESVVRQLANQGHFSNPVMYGMLHPSSENTYRFQYLLSNRSDPIPYRTKPAIYDAGRAIFQQNYLLNVNAS